MSITKDDVKILKSERLTDESDGGGRATGKAVIDNELNNLFPNISRLDRTLGRISMRKAFAGVVTENNDAYMGAHSIITSPAADPLVSTLLFSGSQTDEREEAVFFLESYVVPSIRADWELHGDQLRGQRSITGIQFEQRRVPEIGDVFQLKTSAESQFVRIVSVEHEMRSYVYSFNGQLVTFERRYLKLGISSTLLSNFPGGAPTPTGTEDKNQSGQPKAQVMTTQVADAAKYYGISALDQDAERGALELQVQSVYARLVPSSMRESGLVDQIAGGRRRYNVASGLEPRSVPVTFIVIGSGHSVTYLSTGALIGSVQLNVGGAIYKDDGAGEMVLQSGGAQVDRMTVDYETGRIDAYKSSAFTASGTATYKVAATTTGQTVTGVIGISLATRGFIYTLNLSEAKPRPGTLVVSFMALGKWYELRDYGNGTLSGEGVGTVDYATGSVNMTLTAMPDVSTMLIYSFVCQDDFNFVAHSGSIEQPVARIDYKLPHRMIKPASVSVTSVHGGVQKQLSSDKTGALTGTAGSGFINHARGIISLQLLSTIDKGTEVLISYDVLEDAAEEDMVALVDETGVVTGVIPGAPFAPGSVAARWAVERSSPAPITGDESYSVTAQHERDITDDGNGGWHGGFTGSIDYATGAFTLQPAVTYNRYDTVIEYEEVT